MSIPEKFPKRDQSCRVSARLSSMVTRTHFLLAEEAREEARDRETHCCERTGGVRTENDEEENGEGGVEVVVA